MKAAPKYCAMIFCLCVFGTVIRLSAEEPTGHIEPYSCIVHVHSEMSSGRYSLPKMTEIAQEYGIDVIFLTDNLTHKIQYGFLPFRHVFWVDHSEKAVLSDSAARYLDVIKKENERQSNVLYVAGVEICPRYYWTGSFLHGDLTCHDHQRNIIALGITDPAVLERIPEVRGVIRAGNMTWIIWTRALLVMGALVILLLLSAPVRLAKRSGFSRREIRKSILVGLAAPVFILFIATEIVGYLRSSFAIYGNKPTPKAEQTVIGFLRNHNVVHYWAHPEASDDHQFKCVPLHNVHGLPLKEVSVGFRARTEPYPHLLRLTTGYTGFGGVYEDRTTLTDPGSLWDVVLEEYVEGMRKDPVWCFGEMLYHYEGQSGKRMDNVETVVWAKDRTENSIMDAIRDGAFYARSNHQGRRISLDRWSVECGGNGVEIRLDISAAAEENIRITLIRGGVVLDEKKGFTPMHYVFRDSGMSKCRDYYRAVINGNGALKVVTNPIFVDAPAESSAEVVRSRL
ncbi:MAG: hypothetical protein JXN60_03340 [Lentisphaerae bacterium]|nr:hypothetical protein [Lentisphaerota bacterium]